MFIKALDPMINVYTLHSRKMLYQTPNVYKLSCSMSKNMF